jgi:hypothetical protein
MGVNFILHCRKQSKKDLCTVPTIKQCLKIKISLLICL